MNKENMNENLKNNRIVRHLYYFVYTMAKRKSLQKKAENTLHTFERTFANESEKKACINDMLWTYALYGFGFDEDLYFNFSTKTKKERCAFVADWEHLGYTCSLNNPKNARLYDNKWMTYQTYKDYYCRDVAYIDSEKEQEFNAFISKHQKAIIKPLDSSCGHGVKIIDSREANFSELLSNVKGSFIIEELIEQVPEMAKFHPSSVNTIRVTTIRLDDEVLIVHPFMRMGQHGNHVDNGGAGGIMCTIDAVTGKIIAAADEYGHAFTVHPDSKETIIGFQIPRWDELIATAKELAKVVPENRYTGWDLALTQEGWCMVEANRRGQFVGWQIPTQIGFRAEINGILKRLGVKY